MKIKFVFYTPNSFTESFFFLWDGGYSSRREREREREKEGERLCPGGNSCWRSGGREGGREGGRWRERAS
jgi:hypothetical protein